MHKKSQSLALAIIIPTLVPLDGERLTRLFGRLKKLQSDLIKIHVVLVVNHMLPRDEIKIQALFKKYDVSIVSTAINKGFAQAVNEGIIFVRAVASVDWYFVLNDDAYPSLQLISHLRKQLLSKQYDAISCKVLTSGNKVESVGLVYSPTGLAFPRRTDIRFENQAIFVGTAVFISKHRVEKEIGKHGYIFNPLFFAYAEDLELSLRIIKDKGAIYISNVPLVRHMGSQTAHRGSFFQLYHGYRNFTLTLILLWSSRDLIVRLPFVCIGQMYILAMSMFKGYFLLYPKMCWWIFRNWKSLLWQRRAYGYKT